jgi:hypothetical protein
VIIKFVNRAAHVYDWELPRRVGGTPEAAELSTPTPSVIRMLCKSSLKAKGSILHFRASSQVDHHHHLRCQRREETSNSTRDSTPKIINDGH